VATELSDLVRAEADEVAACDGRPCARREPTREQVGGPTRQRGRQHDQDVGRGDRAHPHRDRRQDEARPRDGRDPGEVVPAREPDEVGTEPVRAGEKGVRPPREQPGEHLRVTAPRADESVREAVEDRHAVQRNRDQQVGGERDRTGADATPIGAGRGGLWQHDERFSGDLDHLASDGSASASPSRSVFDAGPRAVRARPSGAP
jgi:hypothetical protein